VNYTNNFVPFAALFWVVLVVTLGSRTVEGAVTAAAVFAIFDTLVLKGTFLGWILRSEDRIPDFFPISPKWQMVLFGLGAIQFARHPEGLVEASKQRRAARAARRRAGRTPTEPPPAAPSSRLAEQEAVA